MRAAGDEPALAREPRRRGRPQRALGRGHGAALYPGLEFEGGLAGRAALPLFDRRGRAPRLHRPSCPARASICQSDVSQRRLLAGCAPDCARPRACGLQVAQVADAVPLIYGGFLAFFLGITVFLVRAPAPRSRRRSCVGTPRHREAAFAQLPTQLLTAAPPPVVVPNQYVFLNKIKLI